MFALSPGAASAQPVTVVTPENFVRAETDMYFGRTVKDGGLGRFVHNRTTTPIDQQKVIRMNRDTLYSSAVFDLDAGPVSITLPDAGKRFMSLMILDEDHYVVDVIYKPGTYAFSRDKVPTRYIFAAVRILANASDAADVKATNGLQDRIRVEQAATGKFDAPSWDAKSQSRARDALLVLADLGGLPGAGFGKRGEVDPVSRLIAAAAGWGGNPPRDAAYFGSTPKANDGKTIHRLTVKDVPVDAFWSISVYNAKGYFERNALDAYSLNSLTAKPGADGSYTIQFGGCDGKVPNCLPIVKGWNYTVRMYRPQDPILSGKWKFPEPRPV